MPKSFSSIYRTGFRVKQFDYNIKREFLSTEMVDFEGKQVSTSVYKIDDPSIRYNGLRASDFALENQTIVGVEKRPAFCSLQRSEIEREIERVNNLSYEES